MQPIRPNAGKLVGAGCLVLFGAFFTAVASFMLLVTWSANVPWFFLLFIGVFVLFGLAMLGYGLWEQFVKPMLTGIAFGPPSASLSSYQVRLGESVSVQYEQAARRDVEVRGVLIQFVLREHATYRRGSDQHTTIRDNVMAQHEGAGRQVKRGDVLTEACTLRVPIDSMHSLDAPHNKLIWVAKIQVDVPSSPDVVEEIVFTVVPELAEGVS